MQIDDIGIEGLSSISFLKPRIATRKKDVNPLKTHPCNEDRDTDPKCKI